MTKSQIIERIARKQSDLVEHDVALAVNMMIEHMSAWLAGGGRIEIRGFGSFSMRYRRARTAHDPSTGTPVSIAARYAAHFKPGMQLRERVNGVPRTPFQTCAPTTGERFDASAPAVVAVDQSRGARRELSPEQDITHGAN